MCHIVPGSPSWYRNKQHQQFAKFFVFLFVFFRRKNIISDEVFLQNSEKECTYFLSSSQVFHLSIELNPLTRLITVDYQLLLNCISKSSICQQDVKKMCKQRPRHSFSDLPKQLMLY